VSALDTFLQRVEPELNTGCWLWTGAPAAGGYGALKYDGRTQKAHRVSWALHHGAMPPREIKVCHRCDTPACVNPAHLWLGTQQDNIADMVAKGRNRAPPSRFGDANPVSRLTGEKVWQIRHLLKIGPWNQAEIARSYGVSVMTLSRVANWQTWPHVHLNWPFDPHPLYQEQAA
jgi:hypothetical protein